MSKWKRGRKSLDDMARMMEQWEREAREGVCWLVMDSIGMTWGFWDIVFTFISHEGALRSRGEEGLRVSELFLPYVHDGPFAMVPVEVVREAIKRLRLFYSSVVPA